MAYDVLYDNIGILSFPPQLSTTIDVTAPLGTGSPNFLSKGGIVPGTAGATLTAAQARAATASYIPDQVLPYSIQWNIGIQHVVAKDYTFEVRYLGTRGIHLDMQQRINKRAVVTPTHSLPTYLSAPSQAALDSLPLTLASLQGESNLLPQFAAAGFTNGAFVSDTPTGWSTYHGLAVQANRRFSNGLQFQAAYTWSHLIDNSTADFNTTALSPRRPQDFQDLTSEKATSALDRRHRFTFAAYYDAPWFKKSHWLMKNVVGNWTISPVYTYESPELGTVQSAVDSNLNGDTAADRFINNPAGVDGTSSNVTALKNSAGAIVAYLAANPNARYIKAGVGAFANGGRNTLPGRPVNNVDLSMYKNFNLTERFKLQLGAQLFNLFNHPQFIPGFANRIDAVNTVYNNGAVSRNYLTPGNLIFNRPDQVFPSNPRLIQVGAKFVF
jgi:hypothetical protein